VMQILLLCIGYVSFVIPNFFQSSARLFFVFGLAVTNFRVDLEPMKKES
jgi:hypothetical protein